MLIILKETAIFENGRKELVKGGPYSDADIQISCNAVRLYLYYYVNVNVNLCYYAVHEFE